MTRVFARPYRTATETRIRPGAWQLSYAGTVELDPGQLHGWDYSTDISVERSIEVGRDGILKDCGLGDDAALGLVLCWHATGTRTRGTSTPLPITAAPAIETRVELSGYELSGHLELSSRIVLLNATDPFEDPLTPHRAGSILWEDRIHRIELEGGLSRFPVQVIDFRDNPHFHNQALWGVGWDPSELDRPALGALCLYINNAHPAHTAFTGDATRPDLWDALKVDVARTMLDGALDHDEFDAAERSGDQQEESLGAVLAQLHRLVFDSTDADEVRETRRSRRNLYESSIQAAIGMGTT